jgi:hypothetical protein
VPAGQIVPARVMLVDAATDFYPRFGFLRSPIHPMQYLYDLRIIAGSAPVGHTVGDAPDPGNQEAA